MLTHGPLTAAGQPVALRQVVKAVDNRSAGAVELVWNFGGTTPFPYVWLRDCCLCADCFHPTTLSRSLRIDQLQIDIVPERVQVRRVVDPAGGGGSRGWSEGNAPLVHGIGTGHA